MSETQPKQIHVKRTDKLIKLVAVSGFSAGAIYALALLVRLASLNSKITFWRHDALIYLENYNTKLLTEARWVNYVAFPLLKAMPPHLSWYLFYFGWLVFFTLVMRDISRSIAFGLLSSTAITLSGGISAQAFWPSTMLLVPYLLMIVYVLVRKRFKLRVYLAACTLIMGSLSSTIFLLPLFWRRQIKSWDLKLNLGLLIFWVALFILGTAIAYTAVYLITDKIVHPASWRFYNKTDQLSDLPPNLIHAVKGFFNHLQFAFPMKWVWLGLFAVTTGIMIASPAHNEEKLPTRLVHFAKLSFWLFCAAIACHLQGGLLGMHVSYRTSWIILPIVIALGAFAYGQSQHSSNLSALSAIILAGLLVWVAQNGFSQSAKTTRQFAEVSRIVGDLKAHVEQTNPLNFDDADAIVVYAPPGVGTWKIQNYSNVRLNSAGPAEGLLGASYRWVRAFRIRPSQKEVLCISDENMPPHCNGRFLPPPAQLQQWTCGEVYLGVCSNAVRHENSIVLRLPRKDEQSIK